MPRASALVVALAVACQGCSTTPRPSFKVVDADPSSIILNYDPSTTKLQALLDQAEAHCRKYGREAIPKVSQEATFGLRTILFACQPPN